MYTFDAKKHCPSTPTKSSIFLSFLPAACFAFMICSSVTAIVDSYGDPSTVFFMVSSLSILVLLYLSMREFERAVAVKDDQKREHPLKTAIIWSLAVFLNILVSYRVTYVLQSPIVTGIVWGIAAVTSFVGVYLSFFLPAPPLTTNKENAHRGCLKMSIWPLAMDLNLLFSYVVTSVLQSPVMTGVIRGIVAVTTSLREDFIPATAESVPLPMEASIASDINPQVLSSPFIALVVCLVIASLFFILALVYMIKKLETNPDGSEISSSSSLYRDILTVFFLFGCSVSLLRVSSLATLEFQRAVITNDLLRSNFLKITIFSLPMLLTSLCTYRASSVLQVGVMTAAASTIASVSTHNNQPGNSQRLTANELISRLDAPNTLKRRAYR